MIVSLCVVKTVFIHTNYNKTDKTERRFFNNQNKLDMSKILNEKNFKIKKGEFLDSGDIVYISNQQMSINQDLIGDDSDLSGEDIIVIIDDFGDGTETHTFFLINGGFEILIDNNDYYYVIGHYSNIVKHCNNYEPSVVDKMNTIINQNILNN